MIKKINTVCLILGPYRNLTTLTASTLFLHPNCQVLNHGWERIVANDRLNFIKEFSSKKLDHFILNAVSMSKQGKKGLYGGSITKSHAFKPKHQMKDEFIKSKLSLIKKNIHCLIWKESLRSTNALRDENFNFKSVLKNDKRLRFLLPIRNPLDCAHSNLRTKHHKLFGGVSENPDMEEMISLVLNEIAWFKEMEDQFPVHFTSFLDFEVSHHSLSSISSFLGIPKNNNWMTSALKVMDFNSFYKHNDQIVDTYIKQVNKKFTNFPTFKQKFLEFVEISKLKN